jgi:uncharacterized protein
MLSVQSQGSQHRLVADWIVRASTGIYHNDMHFKPRLMGHFVGAILGCVALMPTTIWSQSQGEPPMSATSTQPDRPPHSKPPHTNRLSKQTSPYLLQHAHNPVDWYPWGDEAFNAAREQNKPIFLSIGYSTCYWCHVMERESFENEETAAIMNEHFICIKVDREERPDVDDVYMTATQMLTGQGGWPMSVFLEPANLKPFIAGTYFPPHDSIGRPGFKSVLKQVSNAWQTKRDAIIAQAEQVAGVVKEHLSQAAKPVPLSTAQVDAAIASLLSNYDSRDGGFNTGAPKFPTPVNLDFIIGAAWDNIPARNAVIHTLNRMAIGGMYDQVGGGFHRYSTDEKWLVPHFEKMLYDNGQLASTYSRAFELSHDDFYAEIVRETLDYVLREMTSPAGGFFSAQDAEVNTLEGGNYVWTADEVRQTLTQQGLDAEVDFALEAYGLSQGTNFQDPHHPEVDPKNVLYLIDRPDKLAAKLGKPAKEINAKLQIINHELLAARDQRDQPSKDDKILASWNGLMIAGMADGGRVLNEKKYIDAAAKAANFVLQNMRAKDGALLRSHRNGESKIDGFLEDYALMIRGLIALHKASKDRKLLEDAKALAAVAKIKFWDSTAIDAKTGTGGAGVGGGYFDTLENQSDLFVRVRSTYDGAVPSGNSVMLNNLIDLHELTGEASYLDDAAATLRSVSIVIDEHPTMAMLATLALDRMIDRYPHKLDKPSVTAAVTAPSQPAPSTSTPTMSYGPREAVKISTDRNEITVKPGSPATFEITLKINKSYHINANKPGDEFLIPLEIKLVGAQGLKLAVQYPRGDQVKSEISDNPIFQHSGELKIPVTIEQTAKVTGRPQITLTYQACTSKECMEPKTEIVGMRIISQK